MDLYFCSLLFYRRSSWTQLDCLQRKQIIYIEDGKIIQSAVLLLAAQEQIRGVSSSKINGSSKKNGFEIIEKCITRHSYALRNEKGALGMAQELLEERKTLTDCAWLLVDVISRVGEPLSAYIQAHLEVHIFVKLQLKYVPQICCLKKYKPYTQTPFLRISIVCNLRI